MKTEIRKDVIKTLENLAKAVKKDKDYKAHNVEAVLGALLTRIEIGEKATTNGFDHDTKSSWTEIRY